MRSLRNHSTTYKTFTPQTHVAYAEIYLIMQMTNIPLKGLLATTQIKPSSSLFSVIFFAIGTHIIGRPDIKYTTYYWEIFITGLIIGKILNTGCKHLMRVVRESEEKIV